MNSIPLSLTMQALVFGVAAMIHAGVLMSGYEHREAVIAESVIAVVLVLGLVASALARHRQRTVALAAQAFALVGTCIGIVMISIGVGPQSALDVTLHGIMVALLITGLIVTSRTRRATTV